MKTEKTALRKLVRAEIAALPADYIAQSDTGIYYNIITLREFHDAKAILFYNSVGREPDTARLAALALEMGKTVAFPYCHGDGIMDARVVKDLGELVPALMGIPAPPEGAPVLPRAALDLIIVPALAFDAAGYRLGYGGGYYDRYLAGCGVFTIGLAREKLLKDAVLREEHDVAVACLVTEKSAVRLR